MKKKKQVDSRTNFVETPSYRGRKMDNGGVPCTFHDNDEQWHITLIRI